MLKKIKYVRKEDAMLICNKLGGHCMECPLRLEKSRYACLKDYLDMDKIEVQQKLEKEKEI